MGLYYNSGSFVKTLSNVESESNLYPGKEFLIVLMFQLCENLESENIAKTFRTTKQHDKDALVIEGEKRQEFEK